MTARLTIAIPTYNRAGLLPRALDSALAQTSDDIEIVVSDNGSSDATPALLATYHDKRLRKIRRDPTVTRARHGTLIFSEITTEFVLVLSDDDYIEPDFATEVLRLFDQHPDLSFVYTGCVEHYDDERFLAQVGPEVEDSLSFIAAHYANKRQVSWCACVTRAADLRRIGPQPDERIIGDMFFWTKIAFQGPVGCVARPLAHYIVLRPGGDNESRTTPIVEWAEDVRRLQHQVMQNLVTSGADEKLRSSVAADMRRNLTATVANQFVWSRISGGGRRYCFRFLPYCGRLGGWHPRSVLTVAAALMLSRGALRQLVLAAARRRMKARAVPAGA